MFFRVFFEKKVSRRITSRVCETTFLQKYIGKTCPIETFKTGIVHSHQYEYDNIGFISVESKLKKFWLFEIGGFVYFEVYYDHFES